MRCAACGTENADNVKFCKRCGGPIMAPPQERSQGPPLLPPDYQKRAGTVRDRQAVVDSYYDGIYRFHRLFFMRRVVEALDRGGVFKVIFSALLKVFATLYSIVAGLLCVYLLIQGFKESFGLGVLAVLAVALIVFFVYMLVHTVFIRAQQIAELPDNKYHIIPSVSIFCKLIGEWAFISSLPNFVIGLLFIFAGFGAMMSGEFLSALLTGGLSFFSILYLASPVLGFLTLVFFYWLSEQTIVFADIALNTRGLRPGTLEKGPTPQAP
jgi:hypothetical protein